MRITHIKEMFENSKKSQDVLERARIMLTVQRLASQSRSRYAYKIEADAHLAAVCALHNYRGEDQRVRSELGRIRAESQAAFSAGGGKSRTVKAVL